MSQLLVASTAEEMATAQSDLIGVAKTKIALAIDEAKQAHDMVEQMVAARMSPAIAKTMHRRATSRVTYLTKIRDALEAGYVMMPDLTGDIFAVRVDRK